MVTAKTLTSHYLPAEAIQLVGRTSLNRPIASAVVVLFLFAAAMAFLKKRFGRGGSDIFVTALFLTAIVIFVAACLYTLYAQPGYRVFHPLF
jgi:hypothetical protein